MGSSSVARRPSGHFITVEGGHYSYACIYSWKWYDDNGRDKSDVLHSDINPDGPNDIDITRMQPNSAP